MSRFTKCEVYDLTDVTRAEMDLIECGLTLLVAAGVAGSGPYDPNEVAKLRDEITLTVEGGR